MDERTEEIVQGLRLLVIEMEGYNGGPLGDDLASAGYGAYSEIARVLNSYASTFGNDNTFQNSYSSLGLSSVSMNRAGLIQFYNWLSRQGMPLHAKYAEARDQITNTRTALVRTPEGNLKTIRQTDYKSNASFAADLRGNGYRVLNVWKGKKSDAQVDVWEMLHRRR